MDDLLVQLSSADALTVMQLLGAVVIGLLLAQVLGVIAWCIVRALAQRRRTAPERSEAPPIL
jgi:uncharacterized protein (DUF2062 family)